MRKNRSNLRTSVQLGVKRLKRAIWKKRRVNKGPIDSGFLGGKGIASERLEWGCASPLVLRSTPAGTAAEEWGILVRLRYTEDSANSQVQSVRDKRRVRSRVFSSRSYQVYHV